MENQLKDNQISGALHFYRVFRINFRKIKLNA